MTLLNYSTCAYNAKDFDSMKYATSILKSLWKIAEDFIIISVFTKVSRNFTLNFLFNMMAKK
jgi:hypothetical protein